jgi:hypothetical protein
MLTSEEVREIETIMDDPARRWKMSPGEAITYIEALLEDRAELQAGIERLREQLRLTHIDWEMSEAENERLRAVVEAARPVIEWAREHWSDGLLTDEDQARCGEAYRAYAALAALEGEA